MKSLKGTKTEQNLMTSFIGESQARNKYTYYASKAKKEGYVQISKIFEETANNEKEHAKIWFKLIDKTGTTTQNLESSIKTEGYEAREMYPSFAETAKAEGFDDIAKLFTEVSKIEAEHEKRYIKLLNNLNNNQVFTSDKNENWICLNCGYVHTGTSAPEECPACSHPQDYFAKLRENY